MIRFILLFILGIFVVQKTHAQNLEFKHISIDNGLSQNTVNSIAQDKKGIIWVGTLGGLNKFNGYEFTVFNHNERDSNTISHDRVNVVFIDKEGNLWVGTDGGLNLYNPNTNHFSIINDAINSKYFVYSIKQDKAGKIWIGTQQGLKLLDRKKSRLKDVNLNISSNNKRVKSIYEDDSGLLWIGLAKGFKIYDPIKNQSSDGPKQLQQSLGNSWVQSIKQSQNKDFWFATENEGVFVYKTEENKVFSYKKENGILSNTVRDLFFKDSEHLWMATKMGLSILNLVSGQITNHSYSPSLNVENSLSHPSIKCIFKDKSGNIWLGTYAGGINLIYNFSKIFSYKGIKQGDINPLSNKEVNAILGDSDNKFWIATDGGGLNYWNKTTGIVEVYKYQTDNVLYNFIKDVEYDGVNKNQLWLGSSAGILTFNTSTKKFAAFKDILNSGNVEFNHDYCFLNSAYGLWVGTNYNGLHLIKDGKIIKSYNLANGKLKSDNVSCLLLQNKNLWTGYLLSGLSKINLSTGKINSYVFDKNDKFSLSNNSISCLFTDSKERLWIGTNGGGLNYFDEKSNRFYVINSQYGLANNTIHSIEEDNKGALWVSTNKGIFKIVLKSNQFPLTPKSIETTNYTVLDGLQSNQFLRGSSFKNSAGEMFFGGINGLNNFFPDKIVYNKEIPNIILTDFTIFNKEKGDYKDSLTSKPIEYLNEITLNNDESYFTIKYAALNYIFPERNNYAYKLEGLAKDTWHYVGNQKEATYTGLEPGKYTFLVKASNNSGIWNDTPRQLKIIVLPPWWRTKWAYLFYFLVILGLLYLFNYYTKYTERLKNRIQYETDLYHKEQELSQKKLSFFINISHEIKTPITMIMAPLQKLLVLHEGNTKTSNYLELMNKSGQRLLNLIDQLLDLRKLDDNTILLKAAKGNLVRFTKEIVIVFNSLAKSKNLELKFSSDTDSLELWFDRDKLEKILYNIISNAIKYTPDYGKIEVKIADENQYATINVMDNGVGISKERLPGIFVPFKPIDVTNNNIKGTGVGLAFAKELIDLHHGLIEVESLEASESARGYTKFSIKIPLGKTYLSDKELDKDYLISEDINNYKSYSLKQQTNFQERKELIKKANDNEKFTMLLVEDNPDVINFLAETFEDNFNVIKCLDGAAGVEEALLSMPDIIISDVMMPIMDGIELCSKIKSNIVTSHIPVILLTARSPLIFKLEGLENGADDYVTKPFNFDLLDVKVWNLLENRQKMKSRYQKEITLHPTNTSISTYDDKFLENIMKYIEDNIAEETLNVEDLSQHIGMSRGNLYRKLKVLTGKSPVEFIRNIRLKRATQLLKQHKMYINEVSYMVGFQNVTYFRKCFKEEFGYTPTEFAKTDDNKSE